MEDDDGPDELHCTECGEPLQPSDNFCPACGASTKEMGNSSVSTERREKPNQPTNGGYVEPEEASPSEQTQRKFPETDEGNYSQHGQGVGEQNRRKPPGNPGSLIGRESKLKTVAIATALGIVGIIGLIVGGILAVPLVFTGISEAAFLFAATAVGQILGFGVLGLLYLRRRGFTWEYIKQYLGIRVPSIRELGVVAAGYLAIIGTLIVVSIIASLLLPEPAENQGAAAAADNPELAPFVILMMLLVVGPFEELLFRGVIQNRLRENFSLIPGLVIASALFAVIHVVALAGDPVAMLTTVTILFFPSLVFGYVYEYTGNLVVPALLHGLHNSIIIALIFFAPDLADEEGAFLAEAILLIV